MHVGKNDLYHSHPSTLFREVYSVYPGDISCFANDIILIYIEDKNDVLFSDE